MLSRDGGYCGAATAAFDSRVRIFFFESFDNKKRAKFQGRVGWGSLGVFYA
jgi:hypothetical protein